MPRGRTLRSKARKLTACLLDGEDWQPAISGPRWRQVAGSIVCWSLLAFSSATAQADYTNTRAGRPLGLDDGYALQNGALDIYLAPVAISLAPSQATRWLITPGLSLGILPRTEASLEFPLGIERDGTKNRAGSSGVVLSALHGFNAETDRLPAFALRVSTTIPAGRFEDHLRSSVKGIATRTLGGLRANLNAEYTFGEEESPPRTPAVAGFLQPNRWLAGVALDRSYAYSTFLVGIEGYARQPLDAIGRTLFTGRLALRKQLGPILILESSVSRQLNGYDAGWTIAVGISRTISVAGLIPGWGKWGG
jgi:hypothetical protein